MPDVQPRDIIRARRYGNKTARDYVVDRLSSVNGLDRGLDWHCYAYPRYSGSRPQHMTFEAATVIVVGNYREE